MHNVVALPCVAETAARSKRCINIEEAGVEDSRDVCWWSAAVCLPRVIYCILVTGGVLSGGRQLFISPAHAFHLADDGILTRTCLAS